jgi:hypothetical protein
MYGMPTVVGHSYVWVDEPAWQMQRAADLHDRARAEAARRQLWRALRGHRASLLSLASVEAACTVVECRCAGLQTVRISQIRGTRGSRCCDFDPDFRPLTTRDRWRWLQIAIARLRGLKLPPVDLIEVDGMYFVVDGHHRISVARALGETYIQAQVTIWKIDATLPAESARHAPQRNNKHAQEGDA